MKGRMLLTGAALLWGGLAAAQGDFGAPSPETILRDLATKAAAMADAPLKAAPVIVPKLPAGTKKEFYKPFQAAFLNAINRLQAPKCAAFYGEGGETKFETSEYRFLPMGKPHLNDQGVVTVIGAATHAEGKPPASVFINSEGPFVTQMMFVTGRSGFQKVDMGTNLRDADFGALLLLHELGHVVGKFGPDADDSELNRSYTDQVLKNCFR
ncbi:MAG: hypothetical protein ACHQ49_05545 [Elusimicrobiota bacterium]